MSKVAKITILCEDIQQACFVRRFLMNRGWDRYDFYEKIAPPGFGSAEQMVRERFPSELQAYRSKSSHLKNGLIAVVDADKRGVIERIRDFDEACDEKGIARKGPDERVLFVVPKRNIETWLAYLQGKSVDEETSYQRYEYESLCHRDADKLDVMCKKQKLEGNPPASLERCCTEFQAFWCLIQA